MDWRPVWVFLDGVPRLQPQATVDADPALINLTAEPRFEPLRSDARYTRLIELLGL